MPQPWKCPQCGLVNFDSDPNCKRCGSLNSAPSGESSSPTGIVLEDGYVLPPPPVAGVWRDGTTLVMDKNAVLPDYCVKCNVPANGSRIRKKLSWHHPVLYVLVFGAALFYVIVAMALSKRATIEFGICLNHRQRRRTHINLGFVMLALGVIVPIVGFGYDYPGVGLLGLLLFLISIIWLVIASKVVNVKKIDDRYAWLTGLNKDFLAHFPPLPSGS